MISSQLLSRLPRFVRKRVEAVLHPAADVIAFARGARDARVVGSLGPSAVRGLVLGRGRGESSDVHGKHAASLDWTYTTGGHDGALRDLYRRGTHSQWYASDLAWTTNVDPLSPDVPILSHDFIAVDVLEDMGVRLDRAERRALLHDVASWMLSQFLHGEQGALLASAQVTEGMRSFEAKAVSAVQVMDEARHVEVFHRYLTEKLENLIAIDDNLYVVIDALMSDSRWDMKCLGMQIMVEGLAMGAFGMLYRNTSEPLLRDLLRNVVRDEARHVRFGVVALRAHFREALSDRERIEREEWAFEVARLLRDRFMMLEIYEKRFAGRLHRAQWLEVMEASLGMKEFRRVMFSRLMPNLRAIGLVGPRMQPRYAEEGLLGFASAQAEDELPEEPSSLAAE